MAKTGFRFGLEGEALVSLKRLAAFKNIKYYNRISKPQTRSVVIGTKEEERGEGTLIRELRESYRRTWGSGTLTERNVIINNVYRAVKDAAMGHTKWGTLTGSTYNKIGTWIRGGTLYGGVKGNWPSEVGHVKFPIKQIAPKLERFFNKEFSTKYATTILQHYMGDVYKARRKNLLKIYSMEGDVDVQWSLTGFSIKWPKDAKKRLHLEDLNVPAESYTNKKYPKSRKENFFGLSPDFIKGIALPYLEEYIEALWMGRRYARGGMISGDAIPPDLTPKETQEVETLQVGGGAYLGDMGIELKEAQRESRVTETTLQQTGAYSVEEIMERDLSRESEIAEYYVSSFTEELAGKAGHEAKAWARQGMREILGMEAERLIQSKTITRMAKVLGEKGVFSMKEINLLKKISKFLASGAEGPIETF